MLERNIDLAKAKELIVLNLININGRNHSPTYSQLELKVQSTP